MSTALIRLTVNGADRELPPGSTVRELVAALDLPTEGVAVAVDHLVVPKSLYATTPLKPGAEVEIVRAVGGG